MIEVSELRDQLVDLYTGVLTGMTDPKIDSVLAQVANARIRLVETELKVREQRELVERIEELEGVLEQRDSRWG